MDRTISFIKRNKVSHFPGMEAYLCVVDFGVSQKFFPVTDSDNQQKCKGRIKGKLIVNRSSENSSANMDKYLKTDLIFLTGIERFYIPEEYAETIEKNFAKGKNEVLFSLNGQGKAVMVDLLMNGSSWNKQIK